VVDPAEDAVAIGSGGPYAFAAAMAYLQTAESLDAAGLRAEAPGGLPAGFLGAADIARKSLQIASGICIYTNDKIMVEEIS
jgi:ATP-dependent HslUV protease subunit HslV